MWKPLNVIALGPGETDKITQIISISEPTLHLSIVLRKSYLGLGQTDH
jgi:hypothetical protein